MEKEKQFWEAADREMEVIFGKQHKNRATDMGTICTEREEGLWDTESDFGLGGEHPKNRGTKGEETRL